MADSVGESPYCRDRRGEGGGAEEAEDQDGLGVVSGDILAIGTGKYVSTLMENMVSEEGGNSAVQERWY